MTIKEFSRLCGCNPKTIRYYDHMDLLKPVKVDPFTGYRYYDEDQALQYVKIKNLQIAGFSIEEIKGLLDADNDTVFNAFSEKIKDQEDRLRKTREIQQSYLDEVNRMKEKVSQFRKGVLPWSQFFPTPPSGIIPPRSSEYDYQTPSESTGRCF